MTCREFIEFLRAYLSGELSESERSVFEAHLAECPDCVAYLESYGATLTLGKAAYAATDDPVPADVPEELVQAILAARKTGS
jgi:anti-sigma factor RsiW